MGTGWSQEEASRSPATEQTTTTTVSPTFDTTTTKPKEETTQVKQHETRANPAEKRAQVIELPHNFEAIAKDADSPVDKSTADKLNNQLHAGILLNKKRQKYWVDNKSNKNCFMLFARDLLITWAEDNRFWHWPYLKETSEAFIDVAELLNVCWLEVHGRFDTKRLSPNTLYEVRFVIMINDPAYGWEFPVNFRLTLPDGSKQEHKESLKEKPRGQWIEIPVGEFRTSAATAGEIEISMYEYEGGKWKKGLVIKGAIIQPKNQVSE